jgi:ribonuclease BN (tRNA processing enzyme)
MTRCRRASYTMELLAQVTGPKARGRKVAILGDSADSSRMFDIAQNCDVRCRRAASGFQSRN